MNLQDDHILGYEILGIGLIPEPSNGQILAAKVFLRIRKVELE